MDPKTGQIFKVTDENEARADGLIPIPPAELEYVQSLTPIERQEWARRKLEAEKKKRAELVNGNRKKRRALKAEARKKASAKTKVRAR